jgi:hypothetical protein
MYKNVVVSISFVIALVFFSNLLYAQKIYVLYGFKIGQKSSAPIKQFGKPFKNHKFPDGFSYNAFKMKDHIAVFESDNTRPDLIWAIQIEGKNNPPSLGLNEINLGDNISKVIKIFGKPDSIKEAIDEETKNPMKGIEYYSYDKSSNFSIEATNKIVSSIKIVFNGSNENTESNIDFKKFLKSVQLKDFNKISQFIYADFVFNKNKEFTINTSIIDSLINNKEINNIFFNPSYGIITIQDKDIVESALRVQTEPNFVGYVFKIKKNNIEYELLFFKNYDGWVLKYINQFK